MAVGIEVRSEARIRPAIVRRRSTPMNYQRLYEYRFRNIDQAARAAVWREIAAFIHEQMGSPERVLDPAAGRGEFINAVPARERWGMDQVAYAEGTYEPG